MLKKIVLLSVVVFVVQHVMWLLHMMGFHTTVYNHSPGPCRLVPGVDRIYLFVVNHPPGADRIEKFEYDEKDQSLQHLQSYSDDIMRVVNDVAATGKDRFYFTNYNYYRGGLGHIYEALMLPAFGSVVYCDGQHYTTVASRMSIPNGVTLSKDKKAVYVSTSLYGLLYIYRRESDNSLTLLQEFPMHSHLDNILLDSQSNNLLIGSHPVMHRVTKHMDNPAVPTPSQVLMVNMKDSSHANNITEVYSEDGHTLWGSTVAALYERKMLIGTISHKLLYCEVCSL